MEAARLREAEDELVVYVRLARDGIHLRGDLPEGRQQPIRHACVPRMARHDTDDGPSAQLRWNLFRMGCEAHRQRDRQLARRGLRDVTVHVEHAISGAGLPHHHPGGHRRTDLVQAKGEARDYTEISATAAKSPEELLVLVLRGTPKLAIRSDKLDLLQVVHGPAEASGEPAEAATERQPGDAGIGVSAENGRQALGLGRGIHVAETAAALHVCQPPGWVDDHLAHARHVEHQPAVRDGGARGVVAAALDREQETALSREFDGRLHVGSAQGLDHQGRALADHPVPDRGGFIEPRVRRTHQTPVQLRGECSQSLGSELDRTAVEPADLQRRSG
jgi:hypothetical protein